jgi:outer membrane protein assembly factor BamD
MMKGYALKIFVFSLLFLFSCSKEVKKVPSEPLALFQRGLLLFNEGKFTEAKEVFSRFISYFPEEKELVARAELKMADCAFMKKEYPEAIERYSEFKKRYPFHPDIPYVEFQIGMSYFKQIPSKERDQENTRKALEAFEEVVRKYPDTLFAERARDKIGFCKKRLAEHEIYIGKYYLKKGKYQAALSRFEEALSLKGSGKEEEEALFLLAYTAQKSGDKERFEEYLKLLRENFPQSRFLGQLVSK